MDVRIPLGMGWFELERDQARAAARQHRGRRTHERALTHEGQAVGGGQSGYHDVSFEIYVGWLVACLYVWFDLAKLHRET
ncbi:MAG TPA: hypothetical protein VFW93_14250 [Aquabacterium sp.]|uniref:hypothetical protein n=1 Tax=Aquabacterium sp. TaxID=1872578 RepID=UPI002E343276|nr:hypothetical protein [Aquabacterium sp.]HEX5357378.1 hypothetical protein [Aquabacterium sp.]